MKRIWMGLVIGLCCLQVCVAAAVPGNVRGKVVDAATRQAMDYVNVSVKRVGTSDVPKGTVTDQTGAFIIGDLKEGNYEITISYMGYRTIQKQFTLDGKQENVNLRIVALHEDTQLLGEVEVVGQQSQMKFEIDKKVFNVGQDLSSAGGSASDVLTNVPSVEVDNEGEVSLRGNANVTIWINGKASGLSADNRAQILEQMPAESIEKIEVITNPSAKYSPEGTAGIINIVLKQDRKAGYYGSVQAGVDTKGGYNASGNINYSSGRWDAYASLGYRERKRDGGGYTKRTNLSEEGNTFLNQTTESDGGGGNVFARAGFTYHPTKQDHLNFGAFGMFGGRDNTSVVRYTSNIPGSFVSSLRRSEQDNDMNGGNVEVGYKHEFSRKSYLDLTTSYNNWGMNNSTLYVQQSRYADDSERASYQKQDNDVRNHNWEVQADYVNAFNDQHKLEAGYKGTFARNHSPVSTFDRPDEATPWMENQLLYNDFFYNCNVQALYAAYSGRVGGLGIQLGLRGEYTRTDIRSLAYGDQKSEVAPYVDKYFQLFPSLFLSYALPRGHELQLNYTRRISRPHGRQLNPFLNLTDSANISFGNPYLTPEYSSAFELNYIKTWENHTLSVSGYYRMTDDVIQHIRYLEGNVMKSTHENVAKKSSAGVELIGKNRLFSFLDLTTTVNLYYARLEGFTYWPEGAVRPVTGQAQEDFSWNARMMANFMLPWSVSLQLTGNYNSRQVVAQGHREPNYSLDAGLRKSFLNRKLSVGISGRDLFNSRKWHTVTAGEGFEQESKNWRGGRQVSLTLTYSFGNMRGKNRSGKRNDAENGSMMDAMDMDE
ncbi:MAG: TonB-dependent receptor domain-containing protein [Bacteroidaceae bacterium]